MAVEHETDIIIATNQETSVVDQTIPNHLGQPIQHLRHLLVTLLAQLLKYSILQL